MTEIIVFHHALGLTAGVGAFADTLRRAGHAVTTPDLFDGQTFAGIEQGVAYAKEIGFDTVIERGRAAAASAPAASVYVGFSLGVLPAQMLAQNRAGAKGAVLCYGCVPPSRFGSEWPKDVPVQIHGMEGDEFFQEDLEAARIVAETAARAELFLYAGHSHLFADSRSTDYDEAAADLLLSRVMTFLMTV